MNPSSSGWRFISQSLGIYNKYYKHYGYSPQTIKLKEGQPGVSALDHSGGRHHAEAGLSRPGDGAPHRGAAVDLPGRDPEGGLLVKGCAVPD